MSGSHRSRHRGSFHPFCAEHSFFVARATGEVGTEAVFSFELADGTTALCGLGIIADQFVSEENRFGYSGLLIHVTRLHQDYEHVFTDLLAARAPDPSGDPET